MLKALDAVSKDKLLTSFVISCAHKVETNQTRAWLKLADLVSHDAFTAEAAALIIRSGDIDNIVKTSKMLAQSAIQHNQIAIFTLLFDKTPLSINPSLDALFENKEVQRPFKSQVIEKALKRYQAPITRTDISEYLWTVFKAGGLQIIASTLIKNPQIGLFIFAFHDLRHIGELCDADITNASVYLQFIELGVSQIKECPTFDQKSVILTNVAKIAIDTSAKWGNDSVRGSDIVNSAVRLFLAVKQIDENCAKEGFKQSNSRDQQVCIGNVEATITKSATKKKVHTLKMFSDKPLKRMESDDEWQIL